MLLLFSFGSRAEGYEATALVQLVAVEDALSAVDERRHDNAPPKYSFETLEGWVQAQRSKTREGEDPGL